MQVTNQGTTYTQLGVIKHISFGVANITRQINVRQYTRQMNITINSQAPFQMC